VANAAFDPALVRYGEGYEEQQSFSPTFRAFAEDLARHLAETHRLEGRHVVEIGCGKGDFLETLCEVAGCRGTGIDPTWSPERVPERPGRLRFLRAFYGPEHHDLEADLVLCRHTLEHIPDVGDFLGAVAGGVARREGTVVVFEVPDVTRILWEGAFWDVYYEHCSYFTPGSLARLFRARGFHLLDLWRGFQDQYLILEAIRVEGSRAGDGTQPLEEAPGEVLRAARAFARRAGRVRTAWGRWWERERPPGEVVAVWGGGSKAVAFLGALGWGWEQVVVVDINPHRQGGYLPGCGHRIEPPEALRERRPAAVIVMNPVYEAEIREELRRMGLDPPVFPVDAPPDRA
jgi:hypothetical protein